MLYLEYKPREETIRKEGIIRGAATYFDIANEPTWFQDQIVKDIVKDIDKSILENLRVISPLLGDISVRDLSGGCKTLITMYNEPENAYMTHELGDNCFKWVLEIAKLEDIHLIYSSYFNFPEEYEPFEVYIVNDNSVIRNNMELWGSKYRLCTYI